MTRFAVLLALLLPAAAWAGTKTLPPEEIAALAGGEGAAMAKAAELNGYPGPRHVLELAEQLELTPDQHRAAETLFRAMRAEAKAVGARVLEREAALDRMFAERRAQPAEVEALVRAIAALRGELRFVHLRTHFEMAGLLTPHQTTVYSSLRGAAPGHGAGRHKH